MDAQTHLADTHLRLTISPVVLTYAVMEERLGIDYGYLRVRVELTNRDFVLNPTTPPEVFAAG